MFPEFATCPMTEQKLLDEYFIENRNRLLEIAAFLDRLDRMQEQSSSLDFRMRAFFKRWNFCPVRLKTAPSRFKCYSATRRASRSRF